MGCLLCDPEPLPPSSAASDIVNTMLTPKAKLFILFDGRARSGDTDDAAVITTADTEEEAEADSRYPWNGYSAVWFEYDIVGSDLVNERMRDDIGRDCLL